uniref:DUF2785 domain-containing protein n=1 Tax=Sphingopyxis terrae TaxID=33052 RepID=UPI0036D414D2
MPTPRSPVGPTRGIWTRCSWTSETPRPRVSTHPDIQARSFAALVLARVLDRVRAVPQVVAEETTDRWYGAFAAWFPAEVDTRGWDDTLGWLHAVAHGADAAAAFASVLPWRGSALLDLCAVE